MMRPLRALERAGVAVTVVDCQADGSLDPANLEAAIRPETVMIALSQASNVMGTLLPTTAAGRIARRHNLILLVDAATSAGGIAIDVERDQIDLLAVTGHKSLYGPTGTGALVFGERVDAHRVRPLQYGGTGSRSESEEQPRFLPDAFESGTLNAVGLAGLEAGVRWLRSRGLGQIRAHQISLTQQLIDGLLGIPGVKVHGTKDANLQMAPVSFNIGNRSPSEVGLRLDEEFGVLCRVGLHCAPAAHRTMGTFPVGTVRFASGIFTTEEEVCAALDAVAQLARGK
jgi:selenocysteine lyase/cysteine desulfurase